MAELKLSELTAATTTAATDLTEIAADQGGGNYLSQKITVSDFHAASTLSGTTLAAGVTASSLTKLSTLTSNGFLKTGSGNGTLSVDTTVYLSGSGTATYIPYYSSTNVLTSDANFTRGINLFGVTGATTFTSDTAASKVLVLKGATSQSGTYLDIQNSSATSLINVNSSGYIVFGAQAVMVGTSLTSSNTADVIVGKSNTGSGSHEGHCIFGRGNSSSGQRGIVAGRDCSHSGGGGSFFVIGYGAAITAGSNNGVIGINISNSLTSLLAVGLTTANRLNIYASGSVMVNGGNESSSGTLFVRSIGSGTNVIVVRGAASQTANLTQWQNSAGTVLASVDSAGLGSFAGVTLTDATNLAFGTTTGTKIGTATTQKISLWNATPIVQPTTGVAAATFVANTSGTINDTATFDGYTIGQVVKALRNIGILA